MASAELLKMAHIVDGKVMGVDGRVKGVEGKVQDVHDGVQDLRGDVQDVRGDVHDVGIKVQGVEGRVQDVRGDVQDVDHRVQSIGNDLSSEVQGVDHKIDELNRSYSLTPTRCFERSDDFQGTSSEIVFHDGFLPQIHPLIIITHAKLITPVQLSGFFKEVYSTNGNLLDPSCGYTENVRYSRSPTQCQFLIISQIYSRIGEKHIVVCPSSTFSAIVRLISST